MKEKKNIDRLFQEKFKNFEAHPSDNVWNAIADSQKKKDDRKIIPFWFKLGGIAAALLLLFGISTVLLSDNANSKEQEIVSSPDIKAPSTQSVDSQKNKLQPLVNNQSTGDSSPSTKENVDIDKPTRTTVNNDRQTQVADNSTATKSRNTNKVRDKINSNSNILSQEERLLTDTNVSAQETETATEKPIPSKLLRENAINTPLNNDVLDTKTAIASETKNTDEKDLIAEAQKINETQEEGIAEASKETEKSRNKWNVGAVAAPVYYGDFGGSGLDKQFADNDKSGDVNLSYGVQISYEISPKVKIRTGISNVDLSYNTNEISFSTNDLGRRVAGVDYADNARSLAISDNSNGQGANTFAPETGLPRLGITSNGSLQQRLSYLEIPVEAIYVISDKRLGLSIVGGMSTLLLNDNTVVLNSPELTTNLGTASGVNEVSFTTNIGLGLDYKMTENVIFNIEPSLKYQLNSFDDSVVDFQPYYLGVYTGVRYKF